MTLLRGDDGDGVEVLREVHPLIEEPRTRAEVAAVLSNSLMFRSHFEEAETILFEELERVDDPTGPAGLKMRVYLLLAIITGFENLPADAVPTPDEDLGPPSVESRAILTLAAMLYALGMGPAAAVARFDERIGADPAERELDALQGHPRNPLYMARALVDRWDWDDDGFEAAIAGSTRRGTLLGASGGYGGRAWARLLEGELAEAQVDAESAIRVASASGISTSVMAWTGVALRSLAARGDIAGGEALLDSGHPGNVSGQGLPGATFLIGRGGLRAAAGRHREACEDFRRAGRHLAWIPHPNPEALPWQPGLAGSLAALGEDEEAREVAAETLAAAEANGNPRGIGVGLRVCGAVDGGPEGIEMLRASVQALAGTRARLEYLRSLVELGAALRRANHRKEAREPLAEGLELAHRFGAGPLEDLARTELAAAGARPRSVVRSGVESLTPSEARVARMAAEGMTNREVAQSLTVTPKTVETHLRHVDQKLGRSKRAELDGALAAERGGG
jgi:DNA-binding CsgD family transcriptional regulator